MHHPQTQSNEEKLCFLLHLFIIFCGRPPSFMSVCCPSPSLSAWVDLHSPCLSHQLPSDSPLLSVLVLSTTASWPLYPSSTSVLSASEGRKGTAKTACNTQHIRPRPYSIVPAVAALNSSEDNSFFIQFRSLIMIC